MCWLLVSQYINTWTVRLLAVHYIGNFVYRTIFPAIIRSLAHTGSPARARATRDPARGPRAPRAPDAIYRAGMSVTGSGLHSITLLKSNGKKVFTTLTMSCFSSTHMMHYILFHRGISSNWVNN